jgi:hypothetical protein
LDKITLVGANKVRNDLFNYVRYGSVISKANVVRNFRDEADMGGALYCQDWVSCYYGVGQGI